MLTNRMARQYSELAHVERHSHRISTMKNDTTAAQRRYQTLQVQIAQGE